MNITPQGSPHIAAQGTPSPARPRSTSGPDRPGAPGAAPRPAAQSLDLSAQAQEFLRLRPRLEALPPASREERIAELRDRIARGAYELPGERIAKAMLRDPGLAAALGLAPRGR